MNWIADREARKTTFWGSPADEYEDNVELTIRSLQAYASNKKIAITYSGGKDSSATLSIVLHAIETKQLNVDDLLILYADTGLELPPLEKTAMATLTELNKRGYKTQIVRAPVDNRLYVRMLGYGYPYPNNRRRWCTRMLKQEPMAEVLKSLGNDWTILTGVRLNESDQRDKVITASCSTGDGECGQGWYQQHKNALAPIVHWRACHVFRWIFNDDRNHLPIIQGIEPVYKLDEFVPNGIRTGCIKCQVVHKDRSFNQLVKRNPEWSWLEPLHELDQLHDWLAQPAQRLIKTSLSIKADGTYRNRTNNVLGAISLEARVEGLNWIKRIQAKTNQNSPDGYHVCLVSEEEEKRILEMIENKVHPHNWDDTHLRGDQLAPIPIAINGKYQQTQLVLPGFEVS